MAINVLAEVKQYLYRHGTATDETVDPVELLRDLAQECERLQEQVPCKKKPKARPKPQTSFP